MPISPTTITDLKKSTAQLDFLLSATNVKIKTLAPDARFCAICQEPFDKSVWQKDNTDTPVNRPVKLECGHVFGIQCLAHLVFTSDFSNRCPLCRAKVMPDSFGRNPSGQSWKAAVPLLRILMMFGGDAATFDRRKALDVLVNGLEREGLTGPVPGKHMHRIMVLYEEFLNQFCDAPQPMDRLAASEARELELIELLRQRWELYQALEESHETEKRRRETVITELQGRLIAIDDDRTEVIEELDRVRKEERAMFFELESLKESQEDAKREVIKKGPKAAVERLEETRKELNTCKKDLRDARNQVSELDKKLKESVVPLKGTGKELENVEIDLANSYSKTEKDERERKEWLQNLEIALFANTTLHPDKTLEPVKQDPATEKTQLSPSSFLLSILSNTTLDLAMIQLESSIFATATNKSIAVIGLSLMHCIIAAVIRGRPSRKSWTIFQAMFTLVTLTLLQRAGVIAPT